MESKYHHLFGLRVFISSLLWSYCFFWCARARRNFLKFLVLVASSYSWHHETHVPHSFCMGPCAYDRRFFDYRRSNRSICRTSPLAKCTVCAKGHFASGRIFMCLQTSVRAIFVFRFLNFAVFPSAAISTRRFLLFFPS